MEKSNFKTSKYLIHNLVIESEFNLHPLKPIDSSKKTDIKILATTIEHTEKQVSSNSITSVDDCLVDIPKIAKFHIQRGNFIEIDPYPEVQMQSVLLYLFGSIMAVCLYQRGMLVLHANSIEINNSAVLFAGNSGAGKSTTAAIFHQKGYNVLSDDIVVLDQNIKALGGFPQIKLFQSTLDELNISSQHLTPIVAQSGKFSYPITHNAKKKLPVSAIYILNPKQNSTDSILNISPIKGIQRFKKLISNTYRNELIEGLGLKSHHLDLCSKLATTTHMINIERPTSVFNGYQLVDMIIEDLKKIGILDDS